MEIEDAVVIETGPEPDTAVLWLHGLGADGHDFEPIVPQLGMDAGCRFIFPHAPVRPVTLNGGMAMRAWFDIDRLDRRMGTDEAGIRASVDRTLDLVAAQESAGIARSRIIIAGFSQGGAVAVAAAMGLDAPVAGLIALSTFIPEAYRQQLRLGAAAGEIPVFQAHGLQDPVVPVEAGRAARDFLLEAGVSVAWHEYAMPHAVCPEEVADIGRWLRARLGD